MTLAIKQGEHAAPWSEPRPGAQVARAAAYSDARRSGERHPVPIDDDVRRHSRCCGTTPTRSPSFATTWQPRLLSREYDARSGPVAGKTSALLGMGMTERQGGSDVRTNDDARGASRPMAPIGLPDTNGSFSAPMCDAHLVLAQAERGLSCFFLPRFLDDGGRNAVRIQRLKDKLGNRSNASSEVEFEGATAWRLGDEGRGVAVIIEMVRHTRLDCAIGSAGTAACRSCAGAAPRVAPARVRPATGRATADAKRAGRSCARKRSGDRPSPCGSRVPSTRAQDTAEAALARLATPALKYWVCKRAPTVVAEAMEVLGGNGYVEESALPRLYREAPLNSIWEGRATSCVWTYSVRRNANPGRSMRCSSNSRIPAVATLASTAWSTR